MFLSLSAPFQRPFKAFWPRSADGHLQSEPYLQYLQLPLNRVTRNCTVVNRKSHKVKIKSTSEGYAEP